MSCTALRKNIKERKCGIFRQIFDVKSGYRESNPLCRFALPVRSIGVFCVLCFLFPPLFFCSFVSFCFQYTRFSQVCKFLRVFFTGSFTQQKRWGTPPFSVRMLTKHQLAVCCLKEHDFRLCAGYFFCAFFSFLFFEVRF